jgi:hypothetical protein
MGGMNRPLLFLVLAGMLFWLSALRVAGAQGDSFFSVLYDVPVMPGLQEVPGSAVAFDTPAGRIAEVQARLTGGEGVDALIRFYDLTLHQMGWQKTSPQTYEREGERLTLSMASDTGSGGVVFRLEPL